MTRVELTIEELREVVEQSVERAVRPFLAEVGQARRDLDSLPGTDAVNETERAMEVLLSRIADRVAEKLGAKSEQQPHRWVGSADVAAMGLMSRAAFRAAARQGLFPADMSGRAFRARLSHVEHYLESRVHPDADNHKPQRARTPDSVEEQINKLLDEGRLQVLPGGKPG